MTSGRGKYLTVRTLNKYRLRIHLHDVQQRLDVKEASKSTISRSKWDELRDKQQEAVRARGIMIIAPHYVVLPACAKSCRRLRRLAKRAALWALESPGTQFVVVGDKHSWFHCNAQIVEEGDWDEDFNIPPEMTFRGDPTDPVLRQALAAGAVDYNELP